MESYGKVVTVTTEFNDEIIIQSVKTGQEIIERTVFDIVKLKERGIRDALIALGWTPPAATQDIPFEPEE